MRGRKLLYLGLTICLFLVTGFSCAPEFMLKEQTAETTTLEWWGIWDDTFQMQPVISAYQQQFPNIKVNYRKWRYEEFEQQILEALAEDRGPDIVSLPAPWLTKYQSKLLPMPALLDFKTIEVKKKVVGEETRVVPVRARGYGQQDILNLFVKQVSKDVVRQDLIYGLPLGADVMAMFYNRDLLDTISLESPPVTWTDFQKVVPQLTRFNQQGELQVSAVGLGTSKNVRHSFDIMSLLMMQVGAVMMTEDQVTFHHPLTDGRQPGLNALKFYTDFANPAKMVYTWHPQQPDSYRAFVQGQTAFYFGYPFEFKQISRDNPKLSFSVAPVPVPEGSNLSLNFINYRVESVLQKSSNPKQAWHFVKTITSPGWSELYLAETGRVPVLKKLAAQTGSDQVANVFQRQIFTAAHWYQGLSLTAAQAAFQEMIQKVVMGETTLEDSLYYAAQQVSQTLK